MVDFAKENERVIASFPEYGRDAAACQDFCEKLFEMVCHACSGMGHAAYDWDKGKNSPFGGKKTTCPT